MPDDQYGYGLPEPFDPNDSRLHVAWVWARYILAYSALMGMFALVVILTKGT